MTHSYALAARHRYKELRHTAARRSIRALLRRNRNQEARR